MKNQGRRVVLLLSVLLSLLTAATACIGISSTGFYDQETFNWRIQTIGQDMINLYVITPALILTAIFVYRKNDIAYLAWAGVIAYTVYTFLIYSFSVHFNRLFIFYCLILGLSVYLLAWFMFNQIKNLQIISIGNKTAGNVTGLFFIGISLAFYFLWLAEILPAVIHDAVPAQLAETGLLTNPVHVIDLSVCLPGIFITGVLMLRRRQVAYLLAIPILAFFILMNITIGWLAFMMKQEQLAPDLSVTIIMAVLAIFSLLLLAWNIKHIKMKLS